MNIHYILYRSAITIFPQREKAGHDYRIWNHQIISYAGYRNADGTVIGDALNVEFTEVSFTYRMAPKPSISLTNVFCFCFVYEFIQKMCTKIGWKGKRTEFDILPLVVSANGHDPDYFDYPPDLVLEVPLSHPT